ncbi:TolC family protein [Algoriphagus sp. NBT04N3]|jgi:outer membrane protein TolC|uniref:TolC family protein n=1 Tax=Algoriphagus sp. NBT04N3 TaxID=2705473 RepID=UPI001C62F31D|nr:TolC family protein [Algoriphagus sp. NBT04N3]QYH38517.1 TolC family protein [Algoriphagus sp. NBT04N3]
MRYFFIVLGLFLSSLTYGQAADTLRAETFISWLQAYHPMARQAEIQLEFGDMELRTARGAFDPLVYGDLDSKQYKETNYYDKREAGVIIPTWAGIELNGTFEQNNGQFLNEERTVPSGGLFAAGAAVNLGQGLILDERRASLRQAQIYQQSTEVERARMLNELYVRGYEAYWNWALTYANQEALEEAVRLTQFRFEGIVSSYKQGDVAAIDTVEAYSQLLNRQYRLQNARNEYFAATQFLSAFLWSEDGFPMVLDEQTIPENLEIDLSLVLNPEELRTFITNHPELQLVDYELAGLEIDRKLKAQSLLPVVKLKYNFLVETLDGFQEAPFFENNYKFGLSVYTPLLWRKARGSLGLAKAKIDFKQNSRDIKALELRTKLEAEINNFSALSTQVQVFSENVFSLQRLLDAEIRKFDMGESSLFLVNAREVSVFDSRLTLNQLIAKRKVAVAKARFAAGIGFE